MSDQHSRTRLSLLLSDLTGLGTSLFTEPCAGPGGRGPGAARRDGRAQHRTCSTNLEFGELRLRYGGTCSRGMHTSSQPDGGGQWLSSLRYHCDTLKSRLGLVQNGGRRLRIVSSSWKADRHDRAVPAASRSGYYIRCCGSFECFPFWRVSVSTHTRLFGTVTWLFCFC